MLFSPQTPAFAYEKFANVSVSGYVKDTYGKNLKDATVEITCNGITKNAQTNNAGRYTIGFSQNTCRDDNKITVFAYNDNQTGYGYGQGTVNNAGNSDVDVSCGSNSISVPEFGLIPGIVAAIVSFGSFFLLKKRYI